MIDPAQLASAFLAGRLFTADDVDIVNDRIPYLWWNAEANRWIEGTISPQDLQTAMASS